MNEPKLIKRTIVEEFESDSGFGDADGVDAGDIGSAPMCGADTIDDADDTCADDEAPSEK